VVCAGFTEGLNGCTVGRAEGAAPLNPGAGKDELVPGMGSGSGLLVPQVPLGPSAAPGSTPQQHAGDGGLGLGCSVWPAASLGFKEVGDRLLRATKSHVRRHGG